MSRLIQTFEQKLHLTPQQILEAKILQLNLSSLEKKIIDEVEKNPVLEMNEDEEKSDEGNQDEENQDDDKDFDWEELVSNPDELGLNKSDNKNDLINNVSGGFNQKNLTDDIIVQLKDLNFPDEEILVAHEILGNLNEQGFLSIESVLISDRLNIDEEDVLGIINEIQKLDPIGIASRNMQECILVQLENLYPEEIIAQKLIRDCFEDFTKKKYDKIIKKLKCSKEDVVNASDLISVLNPNPAVNYFSTNAERIIPDIVIESHEESWIVSVNRSFIPSLKISEDYLKMLDKHNKDKAVRDFIKKKIDSANWLITAIEQRNATYKKVMHSIIKHQNNYFNSDNKKLNPLILKDIAEDIKMDISTISRVTNGKYVQMPWGTKELKAFFSPGIKMKDGKIISSYEVKKSIKKIIDSEDKKNPLNDDLLTDAINKMGYLIARRTVAKYRESLKISVARLRRK